MAKRPALVLSLHQPETQYFTQYARLLREGHPAGSPDVHCVADPGMRTTPEDLALYATVLFCHQDPLSALHPAAYAFAKRVESWCDARGIRFLNRPDALSATGKVEQLGRLRAAGLHAARAVRLRSWQCALEDADVSAPFFLRYDLGHDTEGEDYTDPYESIEALRRNPPEDGRWKPREKLAGLAAIEWIQTRSPDGMYRKYRAWVFGTTVLRGNLTVSRHWFVHYSDNLNTSPHLPEMHAFIAGEPTDQESEVLLRAARALDLDVAAIDYAFDSAGELVVWEANPQPMFPPHWGDTEPFQSRFVDALTRLLTGNGGR